MATFHHQLKSGKKGTANQHAKYITRQGAYEDREDLVAKGHGNLPHWAETPKEFWKAADKFERRNGAAFREHEVALPIELTTTQQIELAQQLINDLAGHKPYEFAIHANTSSLEGKCNTHMHLMISDRLPDGIGRTPEQTFKRFNAKHPDRGGCKKDSGGRGRAMLST
ncbi:MAG: hypothetical protein C0607_15300 [Azoarcus sp.]|nr:MAG: hypothetical protein C0607_15300 [Azoarcus sp.]